MADRPARRALTWLFGDDGGVVTDLQVQVLTSAGALLVLNTVLLSPILSELTAPFGVSDARVGLLITAVTAPAILAIPVMGVLGDRFGRRAVLAPGLVVFGLAGAAIAGVESFRLALGLRVLQGVGFAAAMPVTVILLGDVYNGSREATAQGVRTAGIYAASTVAPWVAAAIVAGSWRYPFLLYGAAVPLGVGAWLVMPATVPTDRRTLGEYVTDLGAQFRTPSMALLLASFAVRFFALYGFYTVVSFYARSSVGISVVAVGSVVALKSLVSIASSTQAGRSVSWLPTAIVVAGGFLLGGLGLALAGVQPSVELLLLGTVAFGIGDGIVAPLQKSLVTQHTTQGLRGGAMSLSFSAQNVGKAAAPLAVGAILAVGDPLAVFTTIGVVGGGVGSLLLTGVYLLRG